MKMDLIIFIINKEITTMKTFSNAPVSEIAQMAYALACENAEQEVNTVNDHGDGDPRFEREERTQNWECMIMTELFGIPVFVDALFICPTISNVFDKERCYYFRIEYRGTTTEQDDIFNAYSQALYYELQKIVGNDCDLCVE